MRDVASEVRVIYGEEFRREISRFGYRLVTLAVPALLLSALLLVPVTQDALGNTRAASAPLGYVDNSGALNIPDSDEITRFDSEEAGRQALLSDEIAELFVIPTDYMETGRVQWLRHEGGLFSSLEFGDRFQRHLITAVVSGRVDEGILTRVETPAEYEIVTLNDQGQPAEGDKTEAQEIGRFLVPFMFAILLIISIFTSSGRLLQSVADDKENRMVELMVTSVRPMSIMAGKVLGLGTAGVIQIAIWLGSVIVIGPMIMRQLPDTGGLDIGPALIATILAFFVAGYFLFAVIMAGLGAATASVREATQISAIVTLPALVPIWISGILFENPNGLLARALSFIPFTAPTAIMVRISADGVHPLEIMGGLAITLAAGLGMLWVAARVFRAGLLMYGQRMTLRRLASAFKEAG